jgi:hypothetical protein
MPGGMLCAEAHAGIQVKAIPEDKMNVMRRMGDLALGGAVKHSRYAGTLEGRTWKRCVNYFTVLPAHLLRASRHQTRGSHTMDSTKNLLRGRGVGKLQ